MKEKIKVDTSMAEEWIDEDTFRFQGNLYKVLPNGQVAKVKHE